MGKSMYQKELQEMGIYEELGKIKFILKKVRFKKVAKLVSEALKLLDELGVEEVPHKFSKGKEVSECYKLAYVTDKILTKKICERNICGKQISDEAIKKTYYVLVHIHEMYRELELKKLIEDKDYSDED